MHASAHLRGLVLHALEGLVPHRPVKAAHEGDVAGAAGRHAAHRGRPRLVAHLERLNIDDVQDKWQ